MKRIARVLFLLIISFFTSSLTHHNFAFDLLSQEDINLFLNESGTPSLSSGIHLPPEEQWETFNMWLCFKTSEAKILDSEVNYDGLKKLPFIVINHLNHEFQFHLSPEIDFLYEDIVSSWNELFFQAQRICIYAAHFPQKDLNGENYSSWFMSKIKTDSGYWEEYSELQKSGDHGKN